MANFCDNDTALSYIWEFIKWMDLQFTKRWSLCLPHSVEFVNHVFKSLQLDPRSKSVLNHIVLHWEAKNKYRQIYALLFDSFCSHLECGPVGVADKNTISDARITASTFHNARHNPKYGRRHERRQHGAWCTKTKTDRKDYLQVDMGTVLSVCAVASQGERKYHLWTTSYKLYLSSDGVTWNAYEETSTAKVWSANVSND